MDIACCKTCNNFYYQLFIKINIVHAVESVCGVGILGRKAAKRASGRSTFFESKPSNWWSHRCHFAFPWGNRPSNVYKSCQNKPFIAFTRIWYTGRIRKGLLLKSTIKGVFRTLTPYPFPSLLFLLTSFSECSLHGPHKINATFRGNAQILLQIAVLFAAQKLHGPPVACKEKADPCKFLAVKKFAKGVWVLTRVGTFSITADIDHW